MSHAKSQGVALFSGGYDSLVATYKTMEVDEAASRVVHMDTGTGIGLNERFVEAVCNEFGWYLVKLRPKRTFWHYAKRLGFPGPSKHSWYYRYLKGHPLEKFSRIYDEGPYLYTGVRKHESDKRMGRVVGTEEEGDFCVWRRPIMDYRNEDVEAFLVEHDLPKNPVVEEINRSGECYCMAYGLREFELDLGHYGEDETPPGWLRSHVRYLKAKEWEVQVYRGRVHGFLKEDHPEVYEGLKESIEGVNDPPLLLDLLRDEDPGLADEIAAIPELRALRKGREQDYAWIGHGTMSSPELRRRTLPETQAELCEDCKDSTSRGVSHPDPDARLLVEPEDPTPTEQVSLDDLY